MKNSTAPTQLSIHNEKWSKTVSVSDQFNGLRELLRRLKASKSTSPGAVISKKLEMLSHR